MCFLYILKNKRGRHYIGITSLDPEERLVRHNSGDVRSTKFDRPWHIVYVESSDDITKARQLEKLIKSWHGGDAFKKFLAKAAGSSNGRTLDSESKYLGSNPSPAALAGKKNLAG